jgi:hypothetical protein
MTVVEQDADGEMPPKGLQFTVSRQIKVARRCFS